MPPTTTAGHALAIIKAGIQAIPGGGSVASLLEDYVPAFKDKAMASAFEELRFRVEKIEGRIVDLSLDDELMELLVAWCKTVAMTTRKEKHQAAAGVLANVWLPEGDPLKRTYTELDHLIRCVDSLSIGAVQVLAVVHEVVAKGRGRSNRSMTFEELVRQLTGRSSQIEIPDNPDLVMGLVGELQRFNLVHVPGAPTIQTPNYGNYQLRLTSQGQFFIESIVGKAAA